jgi:hypothetical protein
MSVLDGLSLAFCLAVAAQMLALFFYTTPGAFSSRHEFQHLFITLLPLMSIEFVAEGDALQMPFAAGFSTLKLTLRNAKQLPTLKASPLPFSYVTKRSVGPGVSHL